MKNSCVIILSILFLVFSMDSFSQKIGQSKSEIKSKSDSGDHHSGKRSHSSSGYDGGDNSFGNLIASGIIQGFMFVTYYAAIGDYELEDHLRSHLTNYPFYNGKSGNYEHPDAVPVPIKYLRFDLENQFLNNNQNLFGNHLKLKIRPMQYFYLQGDFFQLVEQDKWTRAHSNLSLFNFNLCYDRFRFENFNFGWTVGVNYIGNEINEAGFSYGLNAELFIAKNVSIYSSAKWSSINKAVVNEFQIQPKYHIGRFFVSFGYEHLKIGKPYFDFISMGGGIYL